MHPTNIDWADYSWNPITGCLHGCTYCYARALSEKQGISFKPAFHKDRLLLPTKVKEPQRVFVGSMSDVFGEWVEPDWIVKILDVIQSTPRHTYLFLTKNPKRYSNFMYPPNVWLGTTVESPDKSPRIGQLLRAKDRAKGLFVSVEPLLGNFANIDFKGIDLVICGAMTGEGATPPTQEWIDSIRRNKTIKQIHWKGNIKEFM